MAALAKIHETLRMCLDKTRPANGTRTKSGHFERFTAGCRGRRPLQGGHLLKWPGRTGQRAKMMDWMPLLSAS